MLALPEFGTTAHIKLWVGSQDPEAGFFWRNSHQCACGRYWAEYRPEDAPGFWNNGAQLSYDHPVLRLNWGAPNVTKCYVLDRKRNIFSNLA